MIITVSDLPSRDRLMKLDAIERAADSRFHALGIRFAGSAAAPESSASAESSAIIANSAQRPGYFVIAIEEISGDPLGFAHVVDGDGFAHLEQLSVDPAHAGRGYGRSLVKAAISEAGNRGHPEMTLRTYDEIPWNRPFYESCGFGVIDTPNTRFFDRILTEEEKAGLSLHGRRVTMRIRTAPSGANASP